MSKTEYIIYLASNMFRIYVIYRFCRIYFEKDAFNRTFVRTAYLGFYVVNSMAYLVFNYPILNITTNLLGVVVIGLIYGEDIKKASLVSVLVNGINIICDAGVYYLFLLKEIQDHLLLCVASSLVTFMIEILIEKKKPHYNDYVMNWKYWLTLCLIPFGSIVIVAVISLKFNENEIEEIIIALFLLCINGVAFYLFDALSSLYEEENKRIVMEEQIVMYENQLKIMEQMESKVRSIRHNWKNHILLINKMAMENQDEKICDYTSQFLDSMSVNQNVLDTGNGETDAIVNFWMSQANKENIKVDYAVKVPDSTVITGYDLNIILSNLFKNAIEAAEDIPEAVIKFQMNYKMNMLKIQMENPYNQKIIKKSGNIVTRKKDKNHHGIGLKNVKEVVGRYDGDFQITHDDHVFKVSILLYVKY